MTEDFEQEVLQEEIPLQEEEILEVEEPAAEAEIPIKPRTQDEVRKMRQDAKNSLAVEDRVYYDMGWRPKELFAGKNKDGTPKEWVPLEEFKKTVQNNPAVRAERERALERKLEMMHNSVDKVTRYTQLKLNREHKSLEDRINRDLEEAEAVGDLQSYKSAWQQKQALEAEKAEIEQLQVTKADPRTQLDPAVAYEVESFANRNPWYNRDSDMSEYAASQFDLVRKSRPTLSVREILQTVEQNVKSVFSDRFPVQRNLPPVVDSSRASGTMGSQRVAATAKVEYSKLSENEQRQVDQLAKMQRLTREEVVKKYYNKK